MSTVTDQKRRANWPEEIRLGCAALHASDSPAEVIEAARGSLWLIINTAIRTYIRMHSKRLGRVSAQDREDIAAEKALDLLRKIDSRKWKPHELHGPGIEAFLSTVARNGLVDRLRETEWLSNVPAEEILESSIDHPGRSGRMTRPDEGLNRREFARSLRECAERLAPRDRTVWFFRVFYEMPSKRIAAHPELQLEPSHVDVLLQRCRKMIHDCMSKKGFKPKDMPPGTFMALWEAFRLPPMVSGEAGFGRQIAGGS